MAAAIRGRRYRDEPHAGKPSRPRTSRCRPSSTARSCPAASIATVSRRSKGQQLVIAASARELIPYIADAVPGWFQAALTLYDAKGNELAYADHYRFHPDPVLYYEIPADGQYIVEIHDSIYRGREDFVYRITVGELPFVTEHLPAGRPAGARTAVEVQGWNLPATRLVARLQGQEPGVYPLAVHQDGLVSNAVPFAVDTLPECLEKEPNNRAGARPAR